MPRHLEFSESCALFTLLSSVACDRLYHAKGSLSLYLCGLNKNFTQRLFQLMNQRSFSLENNQENWSMGGLKLNIITKKERKEDKWR